MDQATTYALLSAAAYEDARRENDNRAPIPPGWRMLTDPEFTPSGSGANAGWLGSGFTARVFQGPAGQIVIAYAGTEFRLTEAGGVTDFTDGNIPLAVGTYGAQGYQAALLYQQVKARFGANADISFTGHSLGGGLAGLMAVWFDRPATVFDPAPFEASAETFSTAVVLTRARLNNAGYPDAAFQYYDRATHFAARESRVASYAISGEILESIPLLARIESNRRSFLAGAAPRLDSSTRHSIDMLAAVLLLPAFKDAATALPELLPTVFDKSLYGQEVLGLTPNLMMRLIRNEVGVFDPRTGVQTSAPNGLLTKFSADVQQLVQVDNARAESALRTALVTAAADYYYLKDPTAATALFTTSGNAVNFTLTDIQADTSTLKSPRLLADAVWSLAEEAGNAAQITALTAQSWHVQTGTEAMSWTAAEGDTKADAAIGGAQGDALDAGGGNDLLLGLGGNDTLRGGQGGDVLVGGEGNDVLDGGASSDRLYGGAGNDTYRFTGAFGGDAIIDSDGSGLIEVDGQPLTGADAKRVAAGVDAWSDDNWVYSLMDNGSGGKDLIVQRDSSLNQIRIRNWSNGQLGINLGNEVAASVTTNVFTGDLIKTTDASGLYYLLDSNGNYLSAGTQPGAADLINGSGSADSITGGGGNDGLAGREGNDVIDGGDGTDVLLGGLGADTLRGGNGADYIFGSAGGSFVLPRRTDYTPIAAQGEELSRGFNWVVYDPPGENSRGSNVYIVAGTSIYGNGETEGNFIDAGAGNDRVNAGNGADVVYGGADDDDISGMDNHDVLLGQEGNDNIRGDGTQPVDGVYYGNFTPLERHGNDVIGGGAGNDTLVGQGGDDELYGGLDDDKLWGDDNDLVEAPATIHGADYLDGGDGTDELVGGARGDELFGGEGNDSLWGDGGNQETRDEDYLQPEHHGADYMDGEGGHDYLQGEGGADTLFGGAGNDSLTGDSETSRLAGSAHGADYLDGEGGNDVLSGSGGADLLFGGAGADSLFGDRTGSLVSVEFHGADYLDGEEEDDYLAGDGGADTLYGGTGNDSLSGDAPTSDVEGSAHGADFLDGEEGNDQLIGGGGSDQLIGGLGADTLIGDANEATIGGEFHGDDRLAGGEGDDMLIGGGRNDVLNGGEGADRLQGDADTSELGASSHGADVLDGGTGHDTLFGGGGNDSLQGGDGDDWLAGDDSATLTQSSSLTGNDRLDGGAGNDVLVGGNGTDTLIGGAGIDVLVGGAGRDTYVLTAGDGIDTIIDGSTDDDIVLGGAFSADGVVAAQAWSGGAPQVGDSYLVIAVGGDQLQIKDGFLGGNRNFTLGNGSVLSMATLADTITTPLVVSGGAANDVIQGGGGRDELQGGEGNDVMRGGAGLDQISGGAGNDTLDAGAGGGALAGGNGNDTYLFGRGDGAVSIDEWSTDRASAIDTVRFKAGIAPGDLRLFNNGADLRIEVFGTADVLTIPGYFTSGDAAAYLDRFEFDDGTVWTYATLAPLAVVGGTSGDDYLFGAAGNDQLHGMQGNDWIGGIGGNDQLFGDEGDDSLFGGAGDDMLDGGAGWNLLYGNDGNDVLMRGQYMAGGLGADRYVVDAWGTSVVLDEYGDKTSSIDVLTLPADTTAENVSFTREYNSATRGWDDLVLWSTGGAAISVYGFFERLPQDNWSRVERIELGDGTVWTIADLMSRVQTAMAGTERTNYIDGFSFDDTIDALGGNDFVTGFRGNDLLLGGVGDDLLRGDFYGVRTDDDGNDTLDGGAGNDTLYGAGGNDVY
jgi:Ca2+-binding RTX toxin-like protein